ncbi:MAG: ATP-binding protein [Chthoniobacter sp.]|uniref:hybrid sensor histidine kinase/response regulator n=1 Tax=Chthoniobacter sp. TaxID=2510640 RepID=UPI0032A55F5D
MKRETQDIARSIPLTEFEFLVSDEQRYRGIFLNAIEGIFQTTPDGRYLGANPALARIYGYASPEEMQAHLRDISRQLYVRAGRRMEFLEIIEREGKVANFESQVYRRDGSIIWISENAVAVRDEFGRLLYYEGFVVDVTERHEAAAALEQARDELQQSLTELRTTQQQVVQQERLRALGGMVTGVAHDFNNALSLILGYAELLQHECRKHPAGESFVDYAQTIVTASLDAAEIVNRLREFHRPAEPGETHEPLPFNAIVEQSVAFTRPRWSAESIARGMPVEVVTDLSAIPPLRGNAAELREMLTNLIFNAVDAMPQGGTIALRTRPVGPRIELAVTDTGTGMSEEVRRRCLEPFFTTKGERGSGLGLSMVYGIVERHDGTVSIESTPGRGTTFVFTFPSDTAAVISEESVPVSGTRPLRILVVDDQPVQCELISHALQRDWHTVDVASNGREALRLFERREFDLVITDKVMPEMNGDQLALAVKSREPDTRVIMLTGFGGALDGEHQSEFVDLLVAKPASLAELRAAIAKVMA